MIAARDILGPAEARKVCGGVSRHTFARWRRVAGFPDPIRRLESGELWDRRQVAEWHAAWAAGHRTAEWLEVHDRERPGT
jgi:hypothetical protein